MNRTAFLASPEWGAIRERIEDTIIDLKEDALRASDIGELRSLAGQVEGLRSIDAIIDAVLPRPEGDEE